MIPFDEDTTLKDILLFIIYEFHFDKYVAKVSVDAGLNGTIITGQQNNQSQGIDGMTLSVQMLEHRIQLWLAYITLMLLKEDLHSI